ncbi:exonuclease subunit SbcD [Leucothrix arctica]|uniref:Nuclease SbcCD subunit D n=2 Tax=Leucothrix arctica TaxID=1481894 RepID=A0A317CA06_9GAMM|nr:exonuclease subunit SbcD [Leucothrix arctica]
MRILHTSDWHIGQHFISKSRAAEHQAFISWLLEQVTTQKVDAVIVAGDVFDTGTPPSYARKIYNSFIVEMSKLKCQLVVLGGNHDSVSMLDESKELFASLGTHVIPNVQEITDQQVFVLNDVKGEAGAILCAIPFIRPRDVIGSQAGASSSDKQQALGEAIATHYKKLYDYADAKRADFKQPLPIIATGHLTAMGVTTSDSVRDIYVGSLEAFPAKAFPPADYIALGHIHRPQIVAKSEHIRYCGSPIPLSFDELGTQKQVLIAEFADGKLTSVEPLLVPRFQPMQVIRGDLESIQKQLLLLPTEPAQADMFGDLIASEEKPTALPIWLCIEVETQDYLDDLQQRVQAMTADMNVEILQLRRARTGRQAQITQEAKETLNELSVEDVFERRLALETFETKSDQQRLARIRETFGEIVEVVKSGDAS